MKQREGETGRFDIVKKFETSDKRVTLLSPIRFLGRWNHTDLADIAQRGCGICMMDRK